MAELMTTKRVNLYQLGQEMNGAPLRLVGTGDSTDPKTVRSTVSQSALDAAVQAHAADFSVQAPPPVSPAEDGRLAQALAKADAILADPANATDWTAAERKVLLAALVRRVLR